jgi:hypothetical protein
MARRLLILISSFAVAASVGFTLSSCNAPSCGAGTTQVQHSDGKITCEPVAAYAGDTHCDVDAGNVKIVGGQCVSAIQCDPGSTVDINGVCVGTGGGAKCGTVAAGKACVAGRILNFKDNTQAASGQLHVQLYDPVTLLNGGPPIDKQDVDASVGYVFQNFTPPTLGLVVILTGDGVTTVATGTGGQQVGAGNSYKIDAYTILKADADKWGFDYSTGGAYIAEYFMDAKPPVTNLTQTETMPLTGVQMLKDGAVATGQKFFNAGRTGVDGTLTATGTSGTAIVASPIAMGGTFPQFGGMGGGVTTWETLPGGSAGMTATTPPIVIITRFHPNM